MQQLIHRHDLTTEKLVLTALMLDPSNFDTPDAVFPTEVFYSENHRRIYAAAQAVYRRAGVADLHLVAAELVESGMKGALTHLLGIVTEALDDDVMTFTSAYFPAYAGRLRQVYVEREKGKAALMYQQAIADGQDETEARIILDATLDALDQMTPLNISDEEILHLLGSGARFPTGIGSIDRFSGGLTRPGLNVIAARPSVGKSALARSVIRKAAARGHTVFWYSIDQSAGQVYELEIAHLKLLNTTAIRHMSSGDLLDAIRRVREEVWHDRVLLVDKPMPLPTLISHARASGAQLVVVDYLQAVDTGVSSESEYDSVTRVSKALKALALEMNVPVLALSQLSRAAKNGEPPTLAHLRASGQIEQDADQVWGLERDTTAQSTTSQQATLHVLKNKTGPTGPLSLTWHGKYASYEDWAHDSRADGWVP